MRTKVAKTAEAAFAYRRLSTEAVCERFGISRYTLRRWHEDERVGFPRPIFINRRHYYSEADIFRWEMKQAGLDPDVPMTLGGLKTVSGVISDYSEFVDAMVRRRYVLKMSSLEADAITGMQEGYTNKLENWERPYGRGMGPDTFPLWLGGLRVGLVLVELPRRPRSFKAHVEAFRNLDTSETA